MTSPRRSSRSRPPAHARLGLQAQGARDAEGRRHFVVPPRSRARPRRTRTWSTSITLPNLFTWGVGFRVAKPVLVTLQHSWSRWVVYQSDTFVGDKGLTLSVPRDYRNGNVIRGGVEWQATPSLALRLGALKRLLRTPGDHLLADAPRRASVGVSTGLTWAFGSRGLALNAAFFYGYRPEVMTEELAMPGTFQTDVIFASLGCPGTPTCGASAGALASRAA